METLALSRSLGPGHISHLLERRHAMSNTVLISSQDLSLMKKLKAQKKYQLMGLTNACQAHVETSFEMDQELTQRLSGEALTIKEIERRRKISETKKGSIPWNKGRKHPEETIRRIRERTLEALSDPKVRKKMRGMQGTHSKKAKEKISTGLKQIWCERHKRKHHQDRLHRNWTQIIAAAAKIGGYHERELDWDSYYKIRAELISEAKREKIKKRIERKKKKKAREEILARIKEKNTTERKEERIIKPAGIKMKKCEKDGLKLKKRLTKLHHRKKKLDVSSSSKEITPDTRCTGDEWDIDFIKERLEIGVSLLDQLQWVKDRRKTEVVSSE